MVVCLLVYVVGLSSLSVLAEGLECLSCSGVTDLSLCDQTAECGRDACYVERVDGALGSRYFAGCRSSGDCKQLRCASSQFSCLHCCHGDICNRQGCGSSLQDARKGLRCFNCDDIGMHERCYQLTSCPAGRSCLRGVNNKFRYSLSCTSSFQQTLCHSVFGPGKTTQCCNNSLCNATPNMALNMTSQDVVTLNCSGHSGGVSPGSHVTTSPPCLDADTNCAALDAKFGVCQTDRATSLCAKTCRKCPGTVSVATCTDVDNNCAMLDQYYGICQVPSKAKDHCAKTCKLCSTDSSIIIG